VQNFGPYRLLQLIGRGGMAEVWRACVGGDEAATLAIKRILPHLCDELPVVEMFLSEARLAMRLRHPNLVATLNAGLLGGQPYIAMELVDGVDLRALLRARPEPLPVSFCVSVVRDLCRALAYVHTLADDDGRALGLIHRDVSHSNVMVQRDGTVKLLDFGVAKAAQLSRMARTRTGEIKGKLGYLAPEVIQAGGYDHRADLFAAGVVLYELLANGRLFEAPDEGALLWLNIQCVVPPPSQRRPEVSPALDAIVRRALARDSEERYGSGEELARDLDALLGEAGWSVADTRALLRERAPAPTVDGTVPMQAAQRSGTHRRWRASAIVIALAIAATLAGGAWLARVRWRANDAAPSAAALAAHPSTVRGVTIGPSDPWRPSADTLSSAELTLVLPPAPATDVAAPSVAAPRAVSRKTAKPARTHQRRAQEVDMVLEQRGLLNPYSP
jgi:eukaryotic-like serine/threonine-protein kinase